MLSNLDFDLISIAVPPLKQEKIINYCLKKSIPVFAEKPLATNIKTVRNILNLQKKLNVPNAIDFELTTVKDSIISKHRLWLDQGYYFLASVYPSEETIENKNINNFLLSSSKSFHLAS